MKRFFAFSRAFISSPRKYLAELDMELGALERTVNFINHNPDKINALVDLINALDRFEKDAVLTQGISQLKKKNYRSLDKLIRELEGLERFIFALNKRHNRSKSGEVVSAQNVFLGGVSRLAIRSVQYWQANEDSLRSSIRYGECINGKVSPSEWWIINDLLAGQIIDTTREVLAISTDQIKAVLVNN